jgi:hypothetical protein
MQTNQATRQITGDDSVSATVTGHEVDGRITLRLSDEFTGSEVAVNLTPGLALKLGQWLGAESTYPH